ncbi:MAG: sugar phosphate nucleotidyltransferase [Pelagibacteraceae bacterium]
MKVLPVIICGGAGTRLFPETKNNLPKQFIDFGGWTMFQKTLERVKSSIYLPPIISTNVKYLSLVEKYLKKYHVKKYKIILEPYKKNTAPAILASILLRDIKSSQPIIFLPSDQLIKDKTQFNKAVMKNAKNIKYKDIYIFGIKPKNPSDQFGYFLRNKNSIEVSKFIEKPSINVAKNLIRKSALWNAGIFLSSKENLIFHFLKYQNKLFNNCLNSIHKSKQKNNCIFLEKKSFNKNKGISFDYAILEKVKNIKSVKLVTDWSDLGSWRAINNHFKKNRKQFYNSKNLFKRPWGTYRNLFRGKNFLIKELIVKKNGCLSLQKHKHRSEHWLIFNGNPEITLNKKILKPKLNDLIFIPKGSVHRIRNKYTKPVKIIEAQIGSILKETDIIRLEDIYGRIKK